MAQSTFNLKQKDGSHPIYTVMLGEHVQDAFIDAYFTPAVPESGEGSNKKAVCQKFALGYTMRNAALYFQTVGGGGRKL